MIERTIEVNINKIEINKNKLMNKISDTFLVPKNVIKLD
jgi:hypothetical protein